MKVQRRFLRKYKDKDYYKYVINIPQTVLKESGIEYGEELKIEHENGKIILKKDNKVKKTK